MTEREIVLALAQKLMGWTVHPRDEFGDYRATVDDGSERLIWTEDRDWVLGEQHWNPLDKIADAWMLVEKLASQQKVCLSICRGPENSNGWHAAFSPEPVRQRAAVEPASPKAARAICLAAYRACTK